MENTEAARRLASLRKHREQTCPVCGVQFTAYGRQKYDKKACANKASYRRVGRQRRPALRSGGEQGAETGGE